MCFSEFIGYTCGHSSPEVLRPCPMTTQFYTNPLCTQHARRPILAPEMCPACQRVIHGRAVLITEWEHRWMHERGVCGCEVQFPDLIRPRVVSRSRPGHNNGRNGQMGNITQGSKHSGAPSIALPKTGRSNMAGSRGVPAHYQERSTKAGQHKLEVAVRIPSLYGAEWVDEHRQLHKDGSCNCAGDFSFYQTPEQSVPSSSALIENVYEQVVQTKTASQTFQDQSHGKSQKNSSSHYSNPKDFSHLGLSCHETSHNSHLHPPHQDDTLTQQSPSSDRASLNQVQLHSSPPSNSQTASRATTPRPPPLVVSSSYPHIHAPQRSPGAIYEVDPTKSTNRLYNLACNEGAKMTALADFQSIEFPRAEGTLPLVGLPIGAGPEGPQGLCHVGRFENCVLHTRNLIACMGDDPTTCLLATKSKSFACLHALKAEGEEGGHDEQQQQALPTRERSQSISSSAEFPDYADSGVEEDRLYLS